MPCRHLYTNTAVLKVIRWRRFAVGAVTALMGAVTAPISAVTALLGQQGFAKTGNIAKHMLWSPGLIQSNCGKSV